MTDKAVSNAKLILQTRKKRAEYFRAGLFDEYDWDLMLLLFMAGAEGKTLDRRTILDEIAVRHVVLDRWITVLIDEKIIDGTSAGEGKLQLSAEGQDKMQRLLSDASA